MAQYDFKVGDEVVVRHSRISTIRYQSVEIRKVARVLKRYVELNDRLKSKWSFNGNVYPRRSGWDQPHIEPATDEWRQLARIEKLRRRLFYFFVNPRKREENPLESLTMDQLERIVAVLDEGKSGD